MSVFTGTTRRIAKGVAVGALGLALTLGTAACSSGKLSQTNDKAAAINGADGTIDLSPDRVDGEQTVLAGNIAVRNLQIMYPADKASEVFGGGGPFKLVFTIANDSNIRTVKLTKITAEQGQVTFTSGGQSSSTPGDAGILAPGAVLNAGVPANVDNADKDGVRRLDVQLDGTGNTVAAGLTVPLTLHFEVYGLASDGNGKPTGQVLENREVTITTPVDSTSLNDRNDIVRDVQPEHHGGGH